MKPGVRRLFIAGAATGGAAFAVHVGSGLMSLRHDAWRPCLVHCDDPLARPANLAVPLAMTSAALLGGAMARHGYDEGRSGTSPRAERGLLALGIIAFAFGTAGVASIARIAETQCAKNCPGLAMAEIPLGALAISGLMAAAQGAGRRVGRRAFERLQPVVSIGRTPTLGIAGRF